MNGKDLKNEGIKIFLDKERTVNFDLNALCELEEKFGSLDKAVKAIEVGGFKSMRTLLYAGLYSNEKLSEEEVGKLITLKNMSAISEEIIKAFEESMPEVDETEKN